VRFIAVCALVVTSLLIPPAAWDGAPVWGATAPSHHPSHPGLPSPRVMIGDPGRSGGEFLDSQVSDPRTFNPILAQETSSTGPLGTLFDGLVEDNGETTETEPALAESWKTSPDGKTWTFVLRQGLQWADGQPLTADDVAHFRQKIEDLYRVNLLLDNLPATMYLIEENPGNIMTGFPLGKIGNDGEAYIFNHLIFKVKVGSRCM